MVILMGLTLSHRKVLHYQQIKEHFVLLPIESMKLVGNICCNFGSMYISIALYLYPYDFDIFSPIYYFHIMCTFSIIILLYHDL